MSATLDRPTMQPVLIGLGISTSAEPGADPVADALAAEALGYDFVSMSDHPTGTQPSYEATTLLTWIAARTSRISIASRVLGVPFRLPAVVAKSAESLHRLSGGRLVLGLGGGYSDDEIRSLGARVGTPREKVEGLADAITIMRGVWAEPIFTHHGSVYSVDRVELAPKPEPSISIWVGTYGNRALAVTGRLADGWIPSLGSAAPERIPEMLDRIHSAAAEAGRDPNAVRAVYNVPVRIDATARSSDDTVSGSAADVVDQLHGFAELGFTGFNLMTSGDQVRSLAEEVLPALRG